MLEERLSRKIAGLTWWHDFRKNNKNFKILRVAFSCSSNGLTVKIKRTLVVPANSQGLHYGIWLPIVHL